MWSGCLGLWLCACRGRLSFIQVCVLPFFVFGYGYWTIIDRALYFLLKVIGEVTVYGGEFVFGDKVKDFVMIIINIGDHNGVSFIRF
jgi:hypothetical protein